MTTHARWPPGRALHTERGLPVRSAPAAVAAPIKEVLASPGHPLDRTTRLDLESRFGRDFSHVRLRTDAAAAASADAVGAHAYTVGQDIIFAAGRYQPGTLTGRLLIAHEITHVVQQHSAATGPRHTLTDPRYTLTDPGDPQEREAGAVARGDVPASQISQGAGPDVVQRQHRAPSPVSVRSPVLEETVTQLSDVAAGVAGRALTAAERAIAASVFGASIDLSRVRLIPTDVLEYRTVGDNIRVPENFTIADQYMTQTLVHELTHVWQYQHGGTAYISHSLQTQIAGALRGNRNFAYDYELKPGVSFFDFTPEQQAFIVENYFAMKRDQISIAGVTGSVGTYSSNHMGPDGFQRPLSSAQRTAEISRELPAHERVIAQMRAAMPEAEQTILLQRASEVMQTQGPNVFREPTREVAPIKPVFEVSF